MLQRMWDGYTGTIGLVSSTLSTGLGREGAFVARRPRTTVVVIALLVAGCAAGWARVHGQSKSDKLWCDTD